MNSRLKLAFVLFTAGCAPQGKPTMESRSPGEAPHAIVSDAAHVADAAREPEESTGPATDSATAKADRPAQDPEVMEAIETYARAMLRDLAAARGVTPNDDWKVDFIDRAGIRAFVDGELAKQFTPADLRIFGRIESAFGVIPFGVDARKLLLDLYEANVLGLYDPERKTLFVGSFVTRRLLEMVLGHELGHGVQDMHVDLAAFLGSIRLGPQHGAADKESARTCLVEGDAHATYLSWLAGAPGPAGVGDAELERMREQILSIDDRATAFPILARMQQLPYAAGTATVLQLAREQGWAAVDALYSDLPDTSEQMLHVDKLISREQPAEISIDRDALAREFAGLTLEWVDSRGEAAWLATLAGPDTLHEAAVATEGWNGDLFVSLNRGDQAPAVLVGVTVWDTESDAKEFHRQLAKYPSIPAAPQVSLGYKRQGRNVFFVFTDPSALDEHLSNADDVFRIKRRTKRRTK